MNRTTGAVLVERDLILYESTSSTIHRRPLPDPQLMPADPVMRARARLFLFRFEQELFCTSTPSRRARRRRPTAPAS